MYRSINYMKSGHQGLAAAIPQEDDGDEDTKDLKKKKKKYEVWENDVITIWENDVITIYLHGNTTKHQSMGTLFLTWKP